MLLRVETAPIKHSGLGVLQGQAESSAIAIAGCGDDAVVGMDVPGAMMAAVAARVDKPLPAGNEGGGVVIAAGPCADCWCV